MSLTAKIMNIPIDPPQDVIDGDKSLLIAYKTGHRDARHAAIDLMNTEPLAAAQATPQIVEALKAMLYIFDRGLDEGTIGRRTCDEAKQALAALETA